MAKFYVVRGRKALWNLFIIVLVLAALVYIFRVESELPEEEMTVEPSRIEQVVVVEPVTVRTIPTKFSEYKLERERMRSRQIELLQNVAYDLHTQGERRERLKSSCSSSSTGSPGKQKLKTYLRPKAT